MGLTNERVVPKILAKIKIYVLTRAELLFTLCYEIPCKWCCMCVMLLYFEQATAKNSLIRLGAVHKLRLQEERGGWSKKSTFCKLYTIENVNGGG